MELAMDAIPEAEIQMLMDHISNLRQYITEIEGHVLDVLDKFDDRLDQLDAEFQWFRQKRNKPIFIANDRVENKLRWDRYE